MWDWMNEQSSSSSVPKLRHLIEGNFMSNDLSMEVQSTQDDSIVCSALTSWNDFYFATASGRFVSLLDPDKNYKVIETFMAPPPAATYLAFFDPRDYDVIAIGMDDSTIQIYNSRHGKVKVTLKSGHQKQISGIASSKIFNILVSSGADAQLCVWSMCGWEKKKSCPILAPPGHLTPLDGETKVQFHNDQYHLLVVHESQIAIYDPQLEYLCMWYPGDSLPSPVSCATYSCDGKVIYAGFHDSAVGIFDFEGLTLLCRIAPSAYISSPIHGDAFPIVMDIAAHPKIPTQFAFSMRDGAIYVIEPSDAEIKSGESTSLKSNMPPSIPSSASMKTEPLETPSSSRRNLNSQ